MNYLSTVICIVSGGLGYKVICSVILLDLILVLFSGPDPGMTLHSSILLVLCTSNFWLVQETLGWTD